MKKLIFETADGSAMDEAEQRELIEGERDKLAIRYPNIRDRKFESPADVFALLLLSCASDGGSLEDSGVNASGDTETMRLAVIGAEGDAAATTAISFLTTGDGLSPGAAAVAAEVIAPDLSLEIDGLLGDSTPGLQS